MGEVINLPQLLYAMRDNKDEHIKFFGHCLAYKEYSKSQNFQDVWALYEKPDNYPGFFVEFGATNGVDGSNSHMLHKKHGWYGIVAEPNPLWHNDLKKNREDHKCKVVTDCVYTKTGETLEFLATDEPDLSTIKGFGRDDEHEAKRNNANTIKVKTISLHDLLYTNDAPVDVDYLSIDTEGSEYDILKSFFEENTTYTIKCITVEHNYNQQNRQNLYNLLTINGYKRKFEGFSRWDDFYIKE